MLRGPPVYLASRCLLFLVERMGCLAARGGLVRFDAAICKVRPPAMLPGVHPIPDDRSLIGGRRDHCRRGNGGKKGTGMRAVIVGAGPTGLYTAIALARRGHDVAVIDRDRGPDGGQWQDRKGVMQFHHPHFFRQQVADALLAEMPEVWHGLLAAGAEPATLPGQPGQPAGLHCRRLTFERVLRSAAEAEPGVRLRTGHVDEVSGARGRATGVRAERRQVDADLVIDAGGRAGRLTRALRAPAAGGDCGIAYVSRQYQLLPGAPHGPFNAPFGVIVTYPGYLAAVLLHDNRTLSALIARPSADRQLAALRTQAVFEAAARAIPPWRHGPIRDDPGRSPRSWRAGRCTTATRGNWTTLAASRWTG
jgi:2-polyprenyl-6-methoxyphenol hydroxylase-like FAD-dependent oxidoreductase